ncbi:hypothetical protein MMC06_004426 [Schaereria dolodes]|nr:hypothetical protein [Schaereria dolodes]
MSSTQRSQEAVTVTLNDLKQNNISFETLDSAFGPSSLGILIVHDLPPDFIDLRMRLLSYASYLANLPPDELDSLTCPSSKYLVGWSHGVETLKSNHPDTLKGSFYVNCAFYHSPDLQSAPASSHPNFPEYTAPNIWPPEHLLPGFRATFEELCALIIDTAALVARACDRYASANIEGYEEGYLERVVKTSLTTKARLLHYFPPEPGIASSAKPSSLQSEADNDSWCATHVDHGCLTGLTSALYINESASPPLLPCTTVNTPPESKTLLSPLATLPSSPDPLAGLYIHSRNSRTTKVTIPPDCLAFQTGETLEIITQGRFRAVPHFVRGPRPSMSNGDAKVARNTLAVFTQPNLEEIIDRDVGTTFAEFARGVVRRHGQ